MPDIYTKVTEAAPQVLESLMTALELRAADLQQREMLHTYLTDAALPQGARVLEVGCGTGAVTRVLASWSGVGETIGVDPSPVFVTRARELAGGLTTVAFEEADGRSLPFAGSTFDAVVFHTTLCHVPEPEVMLYEAVRVLRPGGCLAVFEGDYATGTLAKGAGDPLETCADAFRENFVHDPWLVRRLPALVRAAGVQLQCVRSYGYVEASKPGFMLPSWVDLGADALVASGRIGADMAAAPDCQRGILCTHCLHELCGPQACIRGRRPAHLHLTHRIWRSAHASQYSNFGGGSDLAIFWHLSVVIC